MLKNNKLNSDIEILNQTLKDFSMQKENSSNVVKSLEEQINKLKQIQQTEAERFQNEINTLISENSIFKVKYSKKDAELEVHNNETSNMKTMLEELRESLHKSEKDFFDLDSTNQELKSRLTQKDIIIENSKNETETLKIKIKNLQNN